MAETECTCPGGPNDPYDGGLEACIEGTVYGECENENCGGVCESYGTCTCPLHKSPTHDSGYGGTYSD